MLGYSPRSSHPPQEQTPPRADIPLEQTSPRADTPLGADHPPRSRDTHAPQSRHPPLEQAPPPMGADTRPRSRSPVSRHTPRSRQTPQDTATAADGTHPTGMHSCFLWYHIFTGQKSCIWTSVPSTIL